MTDSVIEFLRNNDIRSDADFYGIVRDYVFGSRYANDEERQRNRYFIKHCLFFTSDSFFYGNVEAIAFTAMACTIINYSKEDFINKLLAGRKIIEIMWPGWFEFLNAKERKGEVVNAYDS